MNIDTPSKSAENRLQYTNITMLIVWQGMLDRRQKVLILSRAIEATFSSSEWTEIGYLTGADEWIDRHPRLLRSLQWNDADYKGHAMDTVAHILDRDPENLKRLIAYEPIATWLKENEPGSFEELRSEAYGIEVAEVIPTGSTDAGLAALADAQALLRSRGPTSAVDRVHTGLHAFLRGACDQADIPYPDDPSPNQLLKLLLERHPRLADLGPRTEDIKRMLRSAASIVDAMGTLRNRASLAHPNEELLDHEAALLVINLARSLLRFLDAKIGAG
jgi:hypothetical protein